MAAPWPTGAGAGTLEGLADPLTHNASSNASFPVVLVGGGVLIPPELGLTPDTYTIASIYDATRAHEDAASIPFLPRGLAAAIWAADETASPAPMNATAARRALAAVTAAGSPYLPFTLPFPPLGLRRHNSVLFVVDREPGSPGAVPVPGAPVAGAPAVDGREHIAAMDTFPIFRDRDYLWALQVGLNLSLIHI
jgi:hypothetical protein